MNYDAPAMMQAVKADGTLAEPDANGNLTLSTGNWYIPLGGLSDREQTRGRGPGTPAETPMFSVQLSWSATFAASGITFEWTNFGRRKSVASATIGQLNHPVTDVEDQSETAGHWLQDNVATDTYASPIAGTGNTITALTIVAGGTNAGSVGVQLANRSARRWRLKLVVTTSSTIRVGVHGKVGA